MRMAGSTTVRAHARRTKSGSTVVGAHTRNRADGSHAEWTHREAIYSDPSAAHEKALRLKSDGAASIKITPRSGRYILRWMERETAVERDNHASPRRPRKITLKKATSVASRTPIHHIESNDGWYVRTTDGVLDESGNSGWMLGKASDTDSGRRKMREVLVNDLLIGSVRTVS